jgi:hypothetical protein
MDNQAKPQDFNMSEVPYLRFAGLASTSMATVCAASEPIKRQSPTQHFAQVNGAHDDHDRRL